MGILRIWAFILFFVVSSCAANSIRSSYQIYPVQAPSAATSFSKVGKEHAQIVADSYSASDQAPIRLTASDGTGLELRSLRVRSVVDGALAFTELKLSFHNPRKREIEGRFEITLPTSARVSRLAMKQGRRWQDAEVVSRRRGQEVYESYLHKQVDPVLLEASVGNRFRARVYPIEAKSDKEIILSYSEELPASGDYELLLAGLPRMERLDVDVHHGERRERFVKRDFLSAENLIVPTAGASEIARRSDELIMMRWVPEAPQLAEVPSHVTVLVDSSASAAGVYGQQVRALEALAAQLSKSYGAELSLEVACFDNALTPIYSGEAKDYGLAQTEKLLAHGAMGASNLGAALRWAGEREGRLLLIGDGIATTGPRTWEGLNPLLGARGPARIDVLSFGSAKDQTLLEALSQRSGGGGGVLLSRAHDAEQWAREMGQAAPQELEIDVAGAGWVWPRSVRSARAGDAVTAFARMDKDGAARLEEIRIERKRGGKALEPLLLPLVDGEQELLRRRWAQAQLEQLRVLQGADPSESRQDQIESISHRFRILTPSTAFLMLESDSDYDRFGIDRRESGDVMTVDATGLRRVHRGESAARTQEWRTLLTTPFATTRSPGQTPAERRAQPQARSDFDIREVRGEGTRLEGLIRDKTNSETLVGVTVVITNVAAKQNFNAITNEEGRFSVSNLPSGTYSILLIYGDAKAKYDEIRIADGSTTRVDARLDLSRLGGEVQVIKGRALIDTSKTSQGRVIDRARTENLPPPAVPGRTFESSLGAVAGSAEDGLGLSFSGSSSMESLYLVDGVNTSALARSAARAVKQVSTRSRPRGARADLRDFRKIRALLRDKQLGSALGRSLRWYARTPANLLAIAALGEALQANAHYALAARAYASILDIYPSRADMHRVASGYLSRLGKTTTALREDALRFAREARPDHRHGIRLLAMELATSEREREAIELLLEGLEGPGDALLRHEIGIIAAAWLRREPAQARAIKEMLDPSGIMVPMEARHYAVLSWESDVARLALLVRGPKARGALGTRFQNGQTGYGPEAFLLEEEVDPSTQITAIFVDQAMMGHAFAQLQVIGLDELGTLSVETRPFVALEPQEQVAMGGFLTD